MRVILLNINNVREVLYAAGLGIHARIPEYKYYVYVYHVDRKLNIYSFGRSTYSTSRPHTNCLHGWSNNVAHAASSNARTTSWVDESMTHFATFYVIINSYVYREFVCMYICMYICMYVCMYVCMYICIYIYIYIYIYIIIAVGK